MVCGAEQKEAIDTIRKKAKQMEARIIQPAKIDVEIEDSSGTTIVYKGNEIKIKLAGKHQLKNLGVAIATIEEMRGQGHDIGSDALMKGLEKTWWPGRLQSWRFSMSSQASPARTTACI